MCVVEFEVQIATCMSRFPIDSCGQFGTPLHDQDIQEQKGIIGFNFHSEFDGRSKAVEMVKKLLQSCWTMWPNHKGVVNISEPFHGFEVSHLKMETESSLQNGGFFRKNKTMDNVQLQKSFISKPSSLTFKSYLISEL
jgi:hypothetical protein